MLLGLINLNRVPQLSQYLLLFLSCYALKVFLENLCCLMAQ